MHLAVRAVILLLLISTAVAKTSKYWWLFPKFDENGSNNQENSPTSAFENNLHNGTEELADVNFSVKAVLNLDSNIDVDAENEENQNDIEGSGMALPKNYSNWINKTETAETSKTISDEDNEGFVLAEDKDLKENQTDAKTIAIDDASQEDNETEVERENPPGPSVLEEGNPDQQPTELVEDEESDEAVHDSVKSDAQLSSKLEEERNDEVAFSGEYELEGKELEIPEHRKAFEERDEAIHEHGDVHPSSKVLLEKLNLESDDTEDPDLFAERDTSIHDHGDAHPSSRVELEETESNIGGTEDLDNFEEDSFTDSEVVPEDSEPVDKSLGDQDNSSSEESNEKNEDKTREDDLERLVEDDLIEDNRRTAENQEMELKGKFGEFIRIEDETNQDEDDPLTGNDGESSSSNLDDDVNLHWVDEEPTNTNSSIMDDNNLELPTTVPIAPMAPIFKIPTCNFEQRPFNLTLLPLNSVNELHGTDTSLLCKLIPYNGSDPMPYFRLTWLFEKVDCQRNASNKNACTTVLTSMSFESPNTTYTLSYNLTKLNHTTHTGLYICDAEIYGCQSDNRNVTQTSKAIYMRVYIKPNYGFHIGIISSACVLLLAILAGLVSYARRVQTRSKNRYQELLSPADIQYYPSKVLELPNSVYNATTTGFIRMSASSFSSKSSFTSNEEA